MHILLCIKLANSTDHTLVSPVRLIVLPLKLCVYDTYLFAIYRPRFDIKISDAILFQYCERVQLHIGILLLWYIVTYMCISALHKLDIDDVFDVEYLSQSMTKDVVNTENNKLYYIINQG